MYIINISLIPRLPDLCKVSLMNWEEPGDKTIYSNTFSPLYA